MSFCMRQVQTAQMHPQILALAIRISPEETFSHGATKNTCTYRDIRRQHSVEVGAQRMQGKLEVNKKKVVYYIATNIK